MKLRKRIRTLCLYIKSRMNIRKPPQAWLTYQIGIPHADRAFDTDFAHQQTIHPSKCELHEFYTFAVEMHCQRR